MANRDHDRQLNFPHDDPDYSEFRLGPGDDMEPPPPNPPKRISVEHTGAFDFGTVDLESTPALEVPRINLYINFDVNDYLNDDHTQAELFELIGKLKDLAGG